MCCLDCTAVFTTQGNVNRHAQKCQEKEATKLKKLKCVFCGAPDGAGNFFRDVYRTGDHIFTQDCWDRINRMQQSGAAGEYIEPTLENYELVKSSDVLGKAFRESRVARKLPGQITIPSQSPISKSPSMSGKFKAFFVKSEPNATSTQITDPNAPSTSRQQQTSTSTHQPTSTRQQTFKDTVKKRVKKRVKKMASVFGKKKTRGI